MAPAVPKRLETILATSWFAVAILSASCITARPDVMVCLAKMASRVSLVKRVILAIRVMQVHLALPSRLLRVLKFTAVM